MKAMTILAIGTVLAVPTFGYSKNDSCGGIRFDRLVQDGKFYVYNADGKGRWDFAKSGRYDAPDTNLRFAYGIKGGRDNAGGMVLFKVVDVAKGADIRDRDVRLSRTVVQRDAGKKGLRRISSMTGKVDIEIYQDVHSNMKDISRTLNRFHTNYRYRLGENRDTFNTARRKVFSFDEVKQVEGERNLIALLLGRPAFGGIRSDEAILGLAATLKYYESPDPRNGEVICFTVKPAEAATRTQVTVIDLDSPGPYADQDEILEGRKSTLKLVWNRKLDEQE